jgi:hypothetical protein
MSGIPEAIPDFSTEKVRPLLSMATISPSIRAEPLVSVRSGGMMTLNWEAQSWLLQVQMTTPEQEMAAWARYPSSFKAGATFALVGALSLIIGAFIASAAAALGAKQGMRTTSGSC